MNRTRQKSIKFGKYLYFADINNRLKAAGINSVKPADCYMSKLSYKGNFCGIYSNIMPYPEISTVSRNATASDLSFVTVNSPMPTSAIPLLTSAIIPFHDPLSDLEPYKSVSWVTVLLAGVGN
jgi:hypothetical protein